MSKHMNPTAPTTPEREFHLVCSSGGSRAILGSAGVLLACMHAGITRFKSIGGISGGSIPTELFSGGKDAKACVKVALEMDFSSLLTRRASFVRILLAYFMQRRNEKVRPPHGVLTSEKLGEFIEKNATKNANGHLWPKGYWTAAVHEDSVIAFCENGVFELLPDGQLKVLSCEPGPLGIAVRGSCAVPGVISAVEWKNKVLFDGVLGPEGRVPASIPMRLFGAKPTDIIAVDVGDDVDPKNDRMTKLWKMICGEDCVPSVEDPPYTREHGLIVVQPDVTSVRSLQFTLTKDQKWEAVMSGYVAGINELALARVLKGDGLVKARAVIAEYKELLERSRKAPKGTLSTELEALLAREGLL